MTMALAAENLTVLRRGRAVLDDAGVTVRGGEVNMIVGPNGSGKTTLLWVLAGLIEPDRGRVMLANSAKERVRVRPPLEGLGMVFQDGALWDHLTAREHLELVLTGKGLIRADRQARVGEALARLRLEGLSRRRPGQMSGGEKQRLAVARALVVRPRWLLLDEPLAHLDGATRDDLFDLLREALVESRAGVLMSSHDPDEALRLGNDVTILLDGKVLQAGAAMDVYNQPSCLPSALAMGPASQVAGLACSGRLMADGSTVIEGIDPHLSGLLTLLLRPEHLEFVAAAGGYARVKRCQWCSGRYRVYANLGAAGAPSVGDCHNPQIRQEGRPSCLATGGSVLVYSPVAWPAGQAGCLRYVGPARTTNES